MREKPNLKTVSDDELLRRLSELLRQSRRVEADLVAHIAEVDARRLFAREAAPSMFAYCTKRLHLSEPEAYLRIAVARASRRHPMLLEMLADGRLHLSGIERLAPYLTEENRETLLERAAHKTKREVEELVAELAPRPGVEASIRKLPARGVSGVSGSLAAPTELRPTGIPLPTPSIASSDGAGALPGCAAPGTRLMDEVVAGALPSCAAPEASANGLGIPGGELRPNGVRVSLASAAAQPASIEPVAPARFRVRFDASTELRDKLERLRALMRSSVPDGDLVKIIDAAVTEKLERLEARRFGKTKKPRKRLGQTDMRPKTRHIPAAVRRFVERRDGGRCTYRDRYGRRCTKRHDLEFHHDGTPFGKGGDHSPKNVRLMCRAHNALLAEHDYGKEVMARFRRSGSLVSEPATIYTVGSPPHAAGISGAARKRTSSARAPA